MIGYRVIEVPPHPDVQGDEVSYTIDEIPTNIERIVASKSGTAFQQIYRTQAEAWEQIYIFFGDEDCLNTRPELEARKGHW